MRAGFMRYARRDIIVGIDPDITASGVAILDTRSKEIQLTTLNFVELLGYLANLSDLTKQENLSIEVVIEYSAGTQHNWHLSHGYESKRVISAKGYDLGRNHQIEQDIYDYVKDILKMEIRRQPPFKKCWKGRDRKISHQEITAIMPIKDRVTNQEKRDAALIAWLAADFPIKLDISSLS